MFITFDSGKKSYPIYLLPASYAIFATLFPDRMEYWIGLLFALVLYLGSYGLGKRICFSLLKTADQTLYFPVGLGSVLAVVYVATSFQIGGMLLYIIWGGLVVLSAFESPILTYRISRSYFLAAPVVLLLFWMSLTPPVFPDALISFLGLPQQYVAAGKSFLDPAHLDSTMPPFFYSMSQLFIGWGFVTGIRVFQIILYFQTLSVLASLLKWFMTEPVLGMIGSSSSDAHVDMVYVSRMDLLVLPALLTPGMALLLHFGTPDLLVALFFCAGIASLMKEFDTLTNPKIYCVAMLFAFALWTKHNVILYVLLIPLLWLGLDGWKFTKTGRRPLLRLLLSVIVLWVPLLIRNAMVLGDPLFPAMAGIVSLKDWIPSQTQAVVTTYFSEPRGILALIATPLLLTFHSSVLGYGAEAGLVLLITIGVYPFARKVRGLNPLLVYFLGCYLLWGSVFHDFRQFLPVYFFLFPASYVSFRFLNIQSPRYLVLALSLCLIAFFVSVISPLSRYPLIGWSQTQEDYLEANLNHLPVVKEINNSSARDSVLLLGETRVAYINRSVLYSGPFGRNPFFQSILDSQTAKELHQRAGRAGISLIAFHEKNFDRLYGPQGVVRLTEEKMRLVREFLDSYTEPVVQTDDVTLYRLSKSGGW